MKKLTLLFAAAMLMLCNVQGARQVNLSTLTEDYMVSETTIFYGTLNSGIKITVASSQKVQLENCTIPGSLNESSLEHAGLTFTGGTSELSILGNCYVGSYHPHYPAIYVKSGAHLIIKNAGTGNDGVLTAESKCGTSNQIGGAGIGGGYNMNAGMIEIKSGVTVNAIGGYYAAGIGAGRDANCSDIRIERTVTKVVAQRGSGASCSIGYSTSSSTCSQCQIGGLDRTTVSGKNGVVAQTYTYVPWDGDIEKLTQDELAVDGMRLFSDYNNGYSGNKKVYIDYNATVTLDYLGYSGLVNTSGGAAITCRGNAKLLLRDESIVRGANNYPGIFVPQGSTLTIEKYGTTGTPESTLFSLKAFGGKWAAGIGASADAAAGNIVIKSGWIEATGGEDGAGIGGTNSRYPAQNITIENGVTKLIATRGSGALHSVGHSSGNITIGGSLVSPKTENPYIFPEETGIEEVLANPELKDGKLIHDGQIYILRNGKLFNALGAEVK